MGCPSEVNIGDNLIFSVCTHDPDTSILTDADSVTYRVYEDETGTQILPSGGGAGTMTKLDDANTTGFYTETLACTVANGFENGKTYTIYIEATVDSTLGGICYAFKAVDGVRKEVERLAGVREWPTYGDAALFAHEANDNAMATFPGSCVWDGSAWRLYYTALNGSGQLICRYRSSTDGKTSWSAGTTVLEPSGSGWDNGRVLIPIVWKEGANDWRMIYTGRDSAGANDAIGYATSTDGITWTKSGSNPVMTGNASNWEGGEIEATGVIKVDSTYYMWYNSGGFATGHDPSARQSSYATSTNLTSWTKSTTCVWGNDDDADVVGPDYGTLGGTCLKLTSNYYYYFSVRTGGNTDYQWIEVWESHLPTFPKANRRFVGIIQTVKDTAFPTREIDVLCFAADDIGMDTFTQASGEIRMYFGAKHSTLWYVGLATASDYIEALRPGRPVNTAIRTITDAIGITAASKLAKSLGDAGVVEFTVETGTLSTTQATTDLSEATDDHYIGRTIVWITGDLKGQATDITDYEGASGKLTFTELTEAPSNTDTGIIV